MGTAWKEIVEEALLRDGLERARAQAAKTTDGYDVVVRTPITFFVRFPREEASVAENGSVDCACVISEDVSICYGPSPTFRNAATRAPFSPKEYKSAADSDSTARRPATDAAAGWSTRA